MADIQDKALKLELKHRYVEAAELWETAGRFEKALRNYAKGNAVKRAIDLALREGLRKQAAQLYLESGMYDKAADVYRQERDYISAARAFVKGGKVQEAAEMFEKAEAWLEAARLRESVKDYMRAGELYNQGGDVTSAARAYALGVESNQSGEATGKHELSRAAEVLARVRDFEKAAELYVQSDDIAEAVVMFVRMGEVERAAKVYSECQADVGFEVLSRVSSNDPSATAFAHMFYLARDYEKSGRVFEGLGEYVKAGRLFEKNRDYHHAAELFAMADDPARAGMLFEKAECFHEAADAYIRAGDKPRAAVAFEKAGDFFGAGRLQYESGKLEKALELLQKLPEDHERSTEAALMVAEMLATQGYTEAALDRYRQLLDDAKVDPSNVDGCYRYARLLIGAKKLDHAEQLLKRIVGFNFGYRDVGQLLEQVRAAKLRGESEPALRAAPAGAAEPSARPVSGESPMVGRLEGFEVLRATSLFVELTLEEMRRFWEVAELRRVVCGTQIMTEGAEGDGLYLIKKGSVYVTKEREGKPEILVQLHPGEYFGEMSLMDPGSRVSAGIVAAEDVAYFLFPREGFLRLLETNDKTALKMHRVFVQTLCRRLRQVTNDLASARASRSR